MGSGVAEEAGEEGRKVEDIEDGMDCSDDDAEVGFETDDGEVSPSDVPEGVDVDGPDVDSEVSPNDDAEVCSDAVDGKHLRLYL